MVCFVSLCHCCNYSHELLDWLLFSIVHFISDIPEYQALAINWPSDSGTCFLQEMIIYLELVIHLQVQQGIKLDNCQKKL